MNEPTAAQPSGSRALAIQPNVANLSVVEVKAQVAAMHGLFKDVMQVDVHYGTIPGTPKPTLFKAGAEKIGLLLQLAPSFKRDTQQDDDHLTVWSECTLIHRPSGQTVASAGAICSTRETKYAFRKATRHCPECGVEAIIKGKAEYGGGWLCFAKKGGCGHKWPDGAKEIESLKEGQEENPNVADMWNTVLKMADKRAHVAATLFGTAASDIFTQDVEDFREQGGGGSTTTLHADLESRATAGERRPVTRDQHAQIAVLIRERGIPLDRVRQEMATLFSIDSRKDLSVEQADELLQFLEQWSPQPTEQAAAPSEGSPHPPPASDGPSPSETKRKGGRPTNFDAFAAQLQKAVADEEDLDGVWLDNEKLWRSKLSREDFLRLDARRRELAAGIAAGLTDGDVPF